MEKLDIVHHKIILLCIILIMLVTGIFFGVKLSANTQGTDGLLIIVFSLSFLATIMLFLIFTQIIHLRDEFRELKDSLNNKNSNDSAGKKEIAKAAPSKNKK